MNFQFKIPILSIFYYYFAQISRLEDKKIKQNSTKRKITKKFLKLSNKNSFSSKNFSMRKKFLGLKPFYAFYFGISHTKFNLNIFIFYPNLQIFQINFKNFLSQKSFDHKIKVEF